MYNLIEALFVIFFMVTVIVAPFVFVDSYTVVTADPTVDINTAGIVGIYNGGEYTVRCKLLSNRAIYDIVNRFHPDGPVAKVGWVSITSTDTPSTALYRAIRKEYTEGRLFQGQQEQVDLFIMLTGTELSS